jgi:hypothetical protein
LERYQNVWVVLIPLGYSLFCGLMVFLAIVAQG